MKQTQKFLFDRSFNMQANGRAVPVACQDKRPPELERGLADACTAAYEKGRKEGEVAARDAPICMGAFVAQRNHLS